MVFGRIFKKDRGQGSVRDKQGLAAEDAPGKAGEEQEEAPVYPGWGAEATFESLFTLRASLRNAQKTAFCLAIANMALLGLCLVLLLVRPQPVYFGMSQEMKLLPMTPLSEPIMNETALKNWVAEAVAASFNLDYLHWQQQLNRVRQNYTRQAFVRFALSLDREGHLPLLRQQRALMHAVVQGTPVLSRSGVVQGTLVWEFELPLLVTYETSVGRISNNVVSIICQVQRVPSTDYPQGVAISSLVTTRRITLQ